VAAPDAPPDEDVRFEESRFGEKDWVKFCAVDAGACLFIEGVDVAMRPGSMREFRCYEIQVPGHGRRYMSRGNNDGG
jgi:hypothetical protein